MYKTTSVCSRVNVWHNIVLVYAVPLSACRWIAAVFSFSCNLRKLWKICKQTNSNWQRVAFERKAAFGFRSMFCEYVDPTLNTIYWQSVTKSCLEEMKLSDKKNPDLIDEKKEKKIAFPFPLSFVNFLWIHWYSLAVVISVSQVSRVEDADKGNRTGTDVSKDKNK